MEIRCNTGNTLRLTELRQFQGELKKRTTSDIEALCVSLTNDGLLMPFAVWRHEGINSLLDGHARLEAMVRLAIDDPSLLEVDLPILFIEAADEAEARNALLQITSQYGHISKKGLATFVSAVPNFKSTAPVMAKVSPSRIKAAKPGVSDEVTLTLRVKKDMAGRIREVLKGVEGVTLL